MFAQFERGIGIAERLEEGLDRVEEDLAVGGEDDVGNYFNTGILQ